MVMLPLWNRNQGAVAAARGERAAAAARLDAARLTARAEVATAETQAAQALHALGLVSDSVVLARKNLDVIRQTHDLGRGTLQDVLTGQRRYLDVEREYTAALRDAFEARTSLEFARGAMK
jgi:cobalt-zinc-cadmium efflux system outer membrane protein